jgi:phosphatidate cytidylyltransferase
MSDNDEPTDRRTEGVRIIGAQEAAEAAGRPDVVRRRRGGEKRYGDRPDTPEPASDLPKITISTTEDSHADRFGSVPVVQPGTGPRDDEPRWSSGDDLPPAYGEHSERGGFGHARIVDDAPSGADAPDQDLDGSAESFDPATYEPGTYEPESFDPATYEPGSFDPTSYEPATAAVDGPLPAATTDEPETGLGSSGGGALDDEMDDDSFVLPHWTEPPTGQVPKVVIGDDAPEPEPLATYGSQPRWREEGERTSVTDFDDLVDDGPALGALGAVEDDFFAEAPYRDDDFAGEEPGDLDDELDDELVAAASRGDGPRDGGRRPKPRPRPREDGTPPASGGGGDRPLGVAIGVGVGLVAIGLACFWLGGLATTALATVVVTIAAFEYFTAVRERGNNPATLLGIVAVAAMMIAAYAAGLAASPIVIGLTVMTGLLWYLWVAPGERSVQNLGLTLLGVLWIGFLGSFATLFLGLGRVLESAGGLDSNPGIGVLIAAVIVAVSHDVGAYFIGKYAGRTPLSNASPNKTQEGLIGGVLCSLVVTFVVVGLVGVSPIGDGLAQAFVFALLCALVAPLGDLCESFIKRDLGIKDMGTVLPGHGGVLDRFDALLFVLPVAYFVTVLFDIWGSVA